MRELNPPTLHSVNNSITITTGDSNASGYLNVEVNMKEIESVAFIGNQTQSTVEANRAKNKPKKVYSFM